MKRQRLIGAGLGVAGLGVGDQGVGVAVVR